MDRNEILCEYCKRALDEYILLFGEERLKEQHFDQTTTEVADLALYYAGLAERPAWLDNLPRKFDEGKTENEHALG